MSSGGITEFLTELSDNDSLAALREAHIKKSVLVFKIDVYPNPITTFIDNFLDKRAILPNALMDFKLPTDKEVSIKFNVGTEIFFIKTFIKSHMNRYYFDMNSKVIQLKRRREPRFLVPKKWNQSAAIILTASKQDKCTVIDISSSGIRLETEIKSDTPLYQRDDIIRIRFQIYKRAEMISTAIVRFVLNRPNTPTIVGLEFAEMPDVQKKRVINIIEDINLFDSTVRN